MHRLDDVKKIIAKGFDKAWTWLSHHFSSIYKIMLSGCLVFLLGDTLYEHVFKSLWNFLSLQDNLSLKCTISCISAWCIYYGFKVSQKVIDKSHVIAIFVILFIYVYYRFVYDADKCSMIFILWKLDSFIIFIFSLFLGVGTGKSYKIFRNRIEYNRKDTISTENDNLSQIPIYIDDPIDRSKEDLFTYSVLSKRLAYSIKKRIFDKSYSIGISAPWGNGKSSFLNLLRKELVVDKNIIVIDFNARASASVDCIQSDFLSILASKLSLYHTGMKSTVKEYMDDINVLANDTLWMKLIGLVDIKDATNSREKLQEGISAIGKKIVVLIDDLDRLTVDEIMEVLKLITKNAAFKDTVFITTYDKKYINGNLENSLSIPNKQSFSDKYFNMEIDLPEGNQVIRSKYLLDELIKLTGNNGLITVYNKEDLEYEFVRIAKYFERYLLTLRDVKRFLNSFCASYIPIQDEVYFKEYILLTLIKYANKELYEDLKTLRCLESTEYENIYIQKPGGEFSKKYCYDVLCELFYTKSNTLLNYLNEHGQKRICWKRSFCIYFYNLDNTNLLHTDISELLKPNIKDEDIRRLSVGWRNRGILVDIKDFFVRIKENQKNKERLESYLKLCIMCYRYTKEKDLFYLSSRYFLDYNKVFGKKYGFKGKNGYKRYLRKILTSETDINATSFFLHHLLFYQLSEIRLEEEDCVFTSYELKTICFKRLWKGLFLFDKNEILASDVLYLVLGCLDSADPSDSGHSRYKIMPKVLNMIKKSIILYPHKYLDNVVSHQLLGKDKIKFFVKDDNPIIEVFSIAELKSIISIIDTKKDSELEITCIFWKQYLDYCKAQCVLEPICSFNGKGSKLREYDYKQYNIIFEGESID